MKAPAKLVCLETYWNEKLFESFSVKPFFEALAPLASPPLRVAHRFVESAQGLAYYTRRPDGVMWRRADLFDAPVYYLAFHGKPGTVISLTGDIGAEPLIEAFAGYGRGYRNLVYFAACSVLRGVQGERFAKAFLKQTGVRAVLGYTTRVDWMASVVADLLFLHRFYRDPSPWRNLRRIFRSVQRDYPRARRLGHLLITRD
ncbi:MAG TPA: hypothetical protein VGP97_17285 [Burkholderiales bacterium]|jgi:hypothetical protein|nr:hypothetical protein [Burkholderiales bacterium]